MGDIDYEEMERERERMREEHAERMAEYRAEQHRLAVAYHRLEWGLNAGALGFTIIAAVLIGAMFPWWLAVPMMLSWVAIASYAITPPVAE